MEPRKDPQPDIHSRQEGIIKVRSLSAEFGSISSIPEDKLTEIGYVRLTNDDGTVEVIPKDRLEQRLNKPNKERLTPFEAFKIELPTSGEKYRKLSEEQVDELSRKIDDLDESIGLYEIESPEQIINNTHYNRVGDFLKSVNTFWAKSSISGAEYLSIANLTLILPRQDGYTGLGDITNFTDTERIMPPTSSEEIVSTLNLFQGQYADVTELTRIFANNLNKPEEDPELFAPISAPEESVEFIKAHGIKTPQELYKALFIPFLENENLSECAQTIKQSESLFMLGDLLTNLDRDNPFYEREKEIKGQLKKASIEKKKEYSQELKQIESSKKRRAQVKQGLVEFCNIPKLVSQDIRKKIKDCKDLLTYSENEIGEMSIILDPSPNPQLDADPGKVSGDCTEGKPLPFKDKSVPVYNVKVFDDKKIHIGNFYLLVTKTKQEPDLDIEEEKKVWHLDAIQIPNSRIDWKKSSNILFDKLGQIAEQQNIDLITCNEEPHLISNYDYIGENVLGENRKRCIINIPPVNTTIYSNFQGSGVALVLWDRQQKAPGKI